MTAYVDHAQISYRGMLMNHLIADTLDELHAMAQQLGLQRAWFQSHDPRRPHYDIASTKRAEALRLGAVAVTSKELVRILARLRGETL